VQEVDHAMGCFYAMRRRVWESVGDYDETILRGQTEDYGVRVLLKGWRVFSIPDVEFTHFHADRAWRDNTADTPHALQAALDRFEEKWGFNRLVPDLDEVRRRYAGTTLLWRLSVTDPLPADGECTDRWQTFASDARLQSRLAHTLQHVADLCPGGSTILEIGCGDGLLGHLLAARGYRYRGVDRSPAAIDIARRFAASAAYPTAPPHFECVRSEKAIATSPGEAPACILLSHLERHPNPRAAIDAAHRLLPDAGLIVATALLRPRATEAPAPVHLYRPHELQAQLVNSGLFQIKSSPAADSTGLLTTTAIRLERAVLAHFQRASPTRRAAG
jgi:SAM-dependent methyltransferase